MTLAKALAGGVACGGLIARPEVAEKLQPGTHAATFGGNPLACARRPGHHRDHRGRRPAGAGRRRSASASAQRFEALQAALSAHPGGARQGRDDRHGTVGGRHAGRRQAAWSGGCSINCTHGTVLRLLPALNLTDDRTRRGLRHPGRSACSAAQSACRSQWQSRRPTCRWRNSTPDIAHSEPASTCGPDDRALLRLDCRRRRPRA